MGSVFGDLSGVANIVIIVAGIIFVIAYLWGQIKGGASKASQEVIATLKLKIELLETAKGTLEGKVKFLEDRLDHLVHLEEMITRTCPYYEPKEGGGCLYCSAPHAGTRLVNLVPAFGDDENETTK
jgi:hypothetical protein